MALYLDLHDLKNNSDLQDRVTVAVIVAAEAIRTDASPPTNQPQRLAWAVGVMADPKTESVRMLWALLAANKDATVTAILAANDAALQAKVDAVVDLFAGS